MSGTSSGPDPFDVLAHEFAERFRRGERPALSEYTDRHPELADQIRELFPALVAMEEFDSEVRPETGPFSGGAAAVPHVLGDYRVIREIGRGGMGVVYEAVQESLGRHVALKVLPGRRSPGPDDLARFIREAKAAAGLHHTNIVPVFGVGEHAGVHYYAMQFIEGQGLDAVLAEVKRLRGAAAPGPALEGRAELPLATGVAEVLITGRFAEPGALDVHDPTAAEARNRPVAADGEAPDGRGGSMPGGAAGSTTSILGATQAHYHRSVARLGVQVAEALAYAHGHGVLHRDIKPANILLDLQGTAWVTDFGLAKAEGSDELTTPGDIVGTLRYMAPERFRGQSDARSDTYGLGLTLYELLTTEPAFGASDRIQLIELVRHAEPSRPRRLDPRIPRDLETIVLKAIAKEPALRYQAAAELAEDLRRFLENRPIRARRAGAAERAWRWCRRNQAVASLLAVVTTLLLAGATGSSVAAFYYQRIAASERTARHQAGRLAIAEAKARGQADLRAAESQAVIDFLLNDMLALAHPIVARGGTLTVREALDRADRAIEEKFADQPLVEAAIREILGKAYGGNGEGEQAKAIRQLRHALALRMAHLGPSDRRTLGTMRILGWNLSDEEGEEMLRRAVEIARRELGPNDPLTFQLTVDYARLLGTQFIGRRNRPAEAIAILEPILEPMRRVQGPDHPVTLTATSYYAVLLVALNRPAEARAVLAEVIERMERDLGPDHHLTLSARRCWARSYLIQGDRDKARSLLEELLPEVRRVTSPGYWLRLDVLSDLTPLLRDQGGRVDEIVALYESEYTESERLRGPYHPNTNLLRVHLLHQCAAAGRMQRARALADVEVAYELRTQGRTSRETAEALNRLAGMVAQAPAAHRRAEDTVRAVEWARIASEAAPEDGHFANTLGLAQYRVGKFQAAIASLERSDRLLEGRPFGANGFLLTMAHARLGHIDTARAHFDRSVAWMDRHDPRNRDLLDFRAEAEQLLRLIERDAAFPADPFAHDTVDEESLSTSKGPG